MFTKGFYLIKDYSRCNGNVRENRVHLREAVDWIYRAQDATPDRGVSHSYAIGKGWAPSYPETTGYIIPTLLNWAKLTGEDEACRRALEMAEWELEVQLDNGAVPSLTTGEPVVFDTGQVIFGWISAFKHSGDSRYGDAAVKAGNWLGEHLDSNFIWKKYGNPGTNSVHTYNVRVAWALIELSVITGDDRYRKSMEGFVDWVLQQEVNRGWFRFNCLSDNDHPLLHTIAYTSQGLLESGLLLHNERCIEAAIRTSDELIKCVNVDGRMAGRYDNSWEPAVKWSCLTGMAQTSIVWQRLHRITGNNEYKSAAEKVNNFLKRTHDIMSSNPGIRGGINGSYPLNGEYGKYRVLNWATKFFIDALILEEYPNFKEPLY